MRYTSFKVAIKILTLIVGISVGVNLFAQVTPPDPYSPTSTINYIRTWDATAPEADANALINRPLRDVKQTTQYFDGLGRPLQTVVKKGSLVTSTGANVDMVSAVQYDEFGREQFKYLPSPSIATDGTQSSGLFKLNPFQQQVAFYNTHLSGQTGETNVGANSLNWAYSQTVFEPSPLNRMQESFAPGASWVGTAGNATETDRNSIKAKYYINTATDAVRIWKVNIGVLPAFSTYSIPVSPELAVYPAGALYKTITVDEHNKQVIEFKDKEGKVVLKKVQLTATADNGTGSDHTGWLCTYYIYDDLNNLRCVIQPRGVELISPTWALTDVTILAEQCFRYEYDQRNRMIMKKVPGAGAVQMVYDARDRLVMTQDANTRQTEQWLVTVYENDLNRPTHSYLITDPTKFNDPNYHRTAAAGSTAYPVLANYTTKTLISETHYDDYTSLPSGLSSTLHASGYAAYLTASASAPDWAEPITASSRTKGLVTWTWSKVLGTNSDRIETAYIYDDKGRVIQVQTYNMTRGKDVLTTQYDFAGKVLGTHLRHVMKGTVDQTFELATKNSYDDLGRLTRVEKKTVPQVGANWKTIAALEYDALGQLKSKKLAPGFGSSGLETLAYAYNIRGWLLGINRDYIQSNTGSKFGFELGYDKQTSVINGGATNTYDRAFYNGNIAGTIWRSAGDGEKRKYDFDYDAANRLLKADFNQYSGGWSNATMNFSVGGNTASGGTMKYDANGNIVEMWQQGRKLSGSDYIDKLSYTYFNGGNKLQAVTDGMTTDHKQGDFTDKNTTATDYGYDLNGNLITDLNRKIGSTTGIDQTGGTAIKYNHLNLVDRINPKWEDGTSKGNIDYDYDALSGGRVRKVVAENPVAANGNRTITTTTHYVNGFVYESKTYSPANPNEANYDRRLLYIAHEEGRMRPVRDANGNITDFVYDYFVKDHLGNVRMVLTDEQQSDAYPVASMEDVADKNNLADPNNYIPYYSNTDYTANSSLRYPISSINGYPTDNYTTPNNYVSKLRGDGQKIGPSIVLKVMAGDKFNIRVNSWYKLNGAPIDQPVSVLNDLLAAMANGIGNLGAGHGGPTATEITNSGVLTPGVTAFLGNMTGVEGRPKAFLNFIMLDDQFKYQGGSAAWMGADGEFKTIVHNGLSIFKNGYLYIYVSNETPNIDVFFDNLQVTHVRGPILEETHYYPFGLTMAGISSKALAFGNPSNKLKYNSKEEQRQEFSDGSGLEWLDYGARMYDAQIGRWHVQDNYSETYFALTPYNYGGNNFVNTIDIDGNLFIFANGFMLSHWQGGTNKTKEYRYKADPGVTYTVPNPNYYNPDRGFYQDGPRNNGKTFSYWEGVDNAYMKYNSDFEGEKAYYTNGSFTPEATANARFSEGLKAGADLIAKLESGEIALKEGETLKIVGHSQGAAYGAGIASALSKHSKYGSLIEFVDYLSPHQPGDIKHPDGVKGRQFSTREDRISSKGWKAKAFGNSKWAKIPGTEMGMDRKDHPGEHHGHMVDSWLNDLINHWRGLGISVTVHE